MIPSAPIPNFGSKQQRLLMKYFSQLNERQQEEVIHFAEFLCQKTQDTTLSPEQEMRVSSDPVILERPESESVIAAIKRLSKSYSMVNRDDLLHETSDLMTSHVIKGRAASEVIDDLEALFLKHYQKISQNNPTIK